MCCWDAVLCGCRDRGRGIGSVVLWRGRQHSLVGDVAMEDYGDVVKEVECPARSALLLVVDDNILVVAEDLAPSILAGLL